VLLLLDLKNLTILEGPLDNVGLRGGVLDPVALLELGPELAEVLELDQVPDGAERRVDDGRLADGGGGGDGARHYDGGAIGFFGGTLRCLCEERSNQRQRRKRVIK
jgi:hypothetical protein